MREIFEDTIFEHYRNERSTKARAKEITLLSKSKTQVRVKIHNLQVQIHELRVQIYELRIHIHELRVQIHELEQ